jgi:hypothetical protein
MESGSLYGVPHGTPYEEWPEDALVRLKDDLGRNGDTSESAALREEVERILAGRRKS